jgi:DnaJ-class molecular chaperone
MDIALIPGQNDYYRMLGLDASAPLDALHGAYRVLARKLHPDVSGNPATAEAMTRANTLFDYLRARRSSANDSRLGLMVPQRDAFEAGVDQLVRYRETMQDGAGTQGQLVDVFA